MWTFQSTGFQSIVEYDPRPSLGKFDPKTKKIGPSKPNSDELPKGFVAPTKETLGSHLLVRSRIKEDLDAMAEYDPDCIRTENPKADYQFRMVIKREAVAQFNYDQTMQIDYNSHVKETINSRAPKVAGGRMTALMAVWTACSKWQPIPPYGHSVFGSFESRWGSKTGTATLPKGGSGSAAAIDANPFWSSYDNYSSSWADTPEPTLQDEVEDLIMETMDITSVDVETVVEEVVSRWGEDVQLDDIPSADLWDLIDLNSANSVSNL